MKEYLKEIFASISDFRFYQKVKDHDPVRSLKYLLKLVLIVTVLLSVRYSIDIKRGLIIASKWAEANLPIIEIQKGNVSADIKQPYTVSTDEFTLIIDTTGQIKSLDAYERGVILGKDKVIYKESEMKTEAYSLSGIEALKIDKEFIDSARNNLLWFLFPILLIVIYASFFIARICQIMLFSVISLVSASMSNVKLEYKGIINIGVYAITASTLLDAFLTFFNINLPHFWIIYSGLYIIYIVIAIMNCKEVEDRSIKEDASI